jgi:hypothetical protein
LLTVAACATAAPQPPAPAASHRQDGTAREQPLSHTDALGAAEPVAAGAGSGTAALTRAPAHQGGKPTGSGPGPAYFHTLPPGAALPSGAQCARWVRARPIAENKGMNRAYNRVKGEPVGPGFLAGDAPQADQLMAPRINGDPFDAFGFEVGRITAMDGLPGPVLPTRIRAPTWRMAATMIWAAPPSWGIGGITRRCRDDFVAGPTSECQRAVLGR